MHVIWGIWHKHGPPGNARVRLERALTEATNPNLVDFLKSQLTELDAAEKNSTDITK
jgi:hypothetical protein